MGGYGNASFPLRWMLLKVAQQLIAGENMRGLLTSVGFILLFTAGSAGAQDCRNACSKGETCQIDGGPVDPLRSGGVVLLRGGYQPSDLFG